MPTINKTSRAIATLKLPRKVPALITFASGIVKAMTGNASFPTPTPAIATVQTAINDLQTAETGALSRVKGAVAVRNEKVAALVTLLEELRTCVQSTADANPESGPSIIQGAGLALRNPTTRAALGFHAKPGGVTGTVKVIAPSAARRAAYDWQYSTDGGNTWLTLPSTLQAKTTVTGLKPLTTVMLRFRAVTKTGESDWSQSISTAVV
jgi:hypothetical protein